MGPHSPPLTGARPAGAGAPTLPVDALAAQAAPNSDLQRLNAVLDGRQAFHQAQGMLAEMAGCTLRRAGEVLLQTGAQLGLQTADAVTTLPFATLVGGGRTLEIRGELDIATTPLLAIAFADRQPGKHPGSSFRLELRDLTFLDVVGLRALSDIEIQITNRGERLQVNLPTSRAVNRTLQFAVAHSWIAPVFTRTAN